MIARIAAAALAVVLLPILTAVAVISGSDPATGPAGGGAPNDIPPAYVPIYQAAARAFSVHWLLLAAIHEQETSFSTDQGPGVTSGANGCGAAGPMQFGIVGVDPYRAAAPDCGALTGSGAGNTWATYAKAKDRIPTRPTDYPHRRDDLPACEQVPKSTGCVYDDLDAISAAASYLHQLGARADLGDRAWQAARRYNGAPAYADAVMQRARAWEAQAADDLTLTAPGGAATTPGARAKLGADGLARAPEDAPEAVDGAIAAGNEISDKPYALQHFPTHIHNPTYDCSSSVSHVLWGAGKFGTAPWVSGELESYGQPGPGKWITIYAHSGHTFVIVAGLRFDTGRYDTGPNAGESGPRWRTGDRPTASFAIRHPRGL